MAVSSIGVRSSGPANPASCASLPLYIELTAAISSETREVADGLNIDFHAVGAVVGIDINHASRKLDLTEVTTTALPLAPAAA